MRPPCCGCTCTTSPGLRHAQALVDLGEAELSLGETERALQSFQECIQQHPRDVAVYRARLLASRAAANMGDLKQAETFLQDNLNGEQLTPGEQGMARFALRPGRAPAQCRARSRGDPAPGRSACSVTPTPRKRPSPATCWPTVRGGGRWTCGRAWARRFLPRSAASERAKAAACSNGPWRPTASCKTTSAAAMRRA